MGLRVSPISNYAVNKQRMQKREQKNVSPSFEARVPQAKMMADFTNYAPYIKTLGMYKLPIHNESIGAKMKPIYTYRSFKDLYEFARSKGVFNYIMNEKTGLVKTSFAETEENELMSDLIWITDTCNNMALVKQNEPHKCTDVFNKVTEFYVAQQGAFDHAIANPHEYNYNGLFWAGEQKVGIGHCFIPDTKEAHPWYPKTRLESIGNYMQTAADLIVAGMCGSYYGYEKAEDVPDSVVNSIANCAAYVKALNYPIARSCGAWEERTFVYSLTSDTSIINEGLRGVMDLMYTQTANENILALRERIYNSKHGDVFKDKEALEQLLKAGERRVRENPNVETLPKIDYEVHPNDKDSLARQYDAAMSFMPQTETLVTDNLNLDAKRKLEILDELSYAIVRDNGAIRYAGDGYLKLDSHTDSDKFSQDFEAEWFLVTEISKGYGSVAKQILDSIEKDPHCSDETIELLKTALNKQMEYINRGYARITPSGMTKANGYPCPAYKVPEAYEAVTDSEGKIKYVPGAHPLTWAAASLKTASDLLLDNLNRIENLWM